MGRPQGQSFPIVAVSPSSGLNSRLAEIVQWSADAIVSETLTGVVETWNAGAERLYGYSAGEMIGRSIFDLIPPNRAGEEAALLNRLQGGEGIDDVETVRLRKNGSPVHVSLRLSPIYHSNGTLTAVSHIARDVTRRRQVEERQRQGAKQESIAAMAAGIAHKYNNLLVGIMGNVSLVLEEVPPGSPLRPLLESALQASERTAQLTLLILACAGQGRSALQTTDLSELVRAAIERMRKAIPTRVRLAIETGSHVPAISASADEIDQLVVNLVRNAVEALGERAGRVKVCTSYVEGEGPATEPISPALAPGSYAVLEVSDNGCGIDEAIRPRIFDPFFSTKFTGRGLGLAVALGIVRAHNGGMQVQSAAGRGSTFRVFLPVAATRDAWT